jgi:hypothetical protein
MFTEGFEKTAFIGKAVGAIGGAAAKATESVAAGAKNFMAKQKAGRIASYRKWSGKGSKMAPSEGLAAGRARRATEKGGGGFTSHQNDVRETKARSDVFGKQTKKEDAVKAAKPSFARKHPFLTAGGLYLGARAAMSGGDKDKQQSPPTVTPGQY